MKAELVVIISAEYTFSYESPKAGLNLELTVMAVDGQHTIWIPIDQNSPINEIAKLGNIKVGLEGVIAKALIDREGSLYPGLNPDVSNMFIEYITVKTK